MIMVCPTCYSNMLIYDSLSDKVIECRNCHAMYVIKFSRIKESPLPEDELIEKMNISPDVRAIKREELKIRGLRK